MDNLPVVPKSPRTSPVVVKQKKDDAKTMDFGEAMKEVLAGKKITKLEWKNKYHYAFLRGSLLTFHEPSGEYHEWVISKADLEGTDYIVV